MNCKMLGISALLALTIIGQTANAQSVRKRGGSGYNNTSVPYGVNGNQARVRVRPYVPGWNSNPNLYFGTNFRTSPKPYFGGYYGGPFRWRLHGCGSVGWTSFSTYGSVFYPAVYPGINLTYYGSPIQPGYQFLVAPGADPYQIVFLYDGLDGCYLNGYGDLVLQTAGGLVTYGQPALYQEINGVRIPVAGNYVLRGNGRVGFEVGSYNTGYPLIIVRR